jgi:IS30 family transposase
MLVPDPGPISPRFLSHDDRIVIADGLQAGIGVKEIAASIGKSFQTVYREIKRNSRTEGCYQPWWAHNQALLRRSRPKQEKLRSQPLHNLVLDKLTEKWSPQQISRFLIRTHPGRPGMQVCAETIYRALFDGLLGPKVGKLRTGALAPQAASARRRRPEQDQEHEAAGPATGRGHRTTNPRTLGRRPDHR